MPPKASVTNTQAKLKALSEENAPEKVHLFPAGYKTPLSLLNERCQKAGWERPNVDARKCKEDHTKWTAVVTLKRKNSKTGQTDAVVFKPPASPSPLAVEKASALEARHFAAVYTLFRCFNHLRLNLQLPPQTRPYWSALEKEKAASPENKKWLWSATPFEEAAKGKQIAQEMAKKETAAAAARSAGTSGYTTPEGRGQSTWTPVPEERLPPHWRDAPKLKMSLKQRELVEATIKASVPTEGELSRAFASDEDVEAFVQQHREATQAFLRLGFRLAYVERALRYVCHVRQASRQLSEGEEPVGVNASIVHAMAHMSLDEALLEALLLNTPEEDLPPAFAQSRPTDATVRIVKGKSSLATSWMTDRLAKQVGVPQEDAERWMDLGRESIGVVLDLMLRRLLVSETQGDTPPELFSPEAYMNFVTRNTAILSKGTPDSVLERRQDEMDALEGLYGQRFRRHSLSDCDILADTSVSHAFDIQVRYKSESVFVRVLYHSWSLYPSPSREIHHLPTFYIVAPHLPAYLRLHLTTLAVTRLRYAEYSQWLDLARAGDGGVIGEMVEFVEAALPDIVDGGSLPDAREVFSRLSGASLSSSRYEIRNATHSDEVGGGAGRARSGPSASALAKMGGSIKKYSEEVRKSKGYTDMLAVRQKLPAYSQREAIVRLIRENRCVIVSGETGSGKTTQVPAFVLDDAIERGEGGSVNMVVTQPRRVSAIGVADRVGKERCEDVLSTNRNSLVGYAIRGERKAGPGCRLLFCTTGVILARLSRGDDPDLRKVSHIFVDEVHERSVDSDFLLLELRDILQRNKHIKVILMSATIDQERFSKYFGGAPCITIPGRTHPVTDYYLEDVIQDWIGRYGSFTPTNNRPTQKLSQDELDAMERGFKSSNANLSPNALSLLATITRANAIDYTTVGMAVASCLEMADAQDGSDSNGDVLVFMPGVMEIQQAMEAIRGHAGKSLRERLVVLPLHANLSSEEQRAVFKPTPHGMRKVVVSTNVAETSITIDGIVYVVDSGRVKENTFDPSTGVVKLVETWTSQAASRQRRGRAGRTRPGVCIKLFTRYTERYEQSPAPRPEIQRIPLEQLCLQIKAMRPKADVQAYMSRALDAPDVRAIEKAWQTLVDLSAVESVADERVRFEARLTPLGRHLSLIPVDLRLGKMLVLSCVFKCVDRILTVAALLSSKPLFITAMERREDSKSARRRYYTGTSDIVTDVVAFEACWKARKEMPNSEWRSMADDMCLSMSAFRDVVTQRNEYFSALKSVGFVPAKTRITSEALNVNGENVNLIKAIFFAGMTNKRLVKVKPPKSVYDQSHNGTIEREKEAREVKFFEWEDRVFPHPSSLLFTETQFESRFATYFSKAVTTKPYLRDVNEVPVYGVLLFGNGPVMIDVDRGAMGVGEPIQLSAEKSTASSSLSHATIEANERRIRQGARKTDPWIVVRSWPRAAVLVSLLRRLFDADLEAHLDDTEYAVSNASPVIETIVRLLEKDGV